MCQRMPLSANPFTPSPLTASVRVCRPTRRPSAYKSARSRPFSARRVHEVDDALDEVIVEWLARDQQAEIQRAEQRLDDRAASASRLDLAAVPGTRARSSGRARAARPRTADSRRRYRDCPVLHRRRRGPPPRRRGGLDRGRTARQLQQVTAKRTGVGDRDGLRRLLQHRVEHQRLLGPPPPVDRGLVHLGACGDAVEADAGVAAVGQLRQRRGDHGRADPRATSARPPGSGRRFPCCIHDA